MLEDTLINYKISEDMMPVHKEGTIPLKNGVAKIDAGTMIKAGFLRCQVSAVVDGQTHLGLATAGYTPESIEPTTTEPKDFLDFWVRTISDARRIPLNPQMILLPEQSTLQVNVYHINFQNNKWGSKIYGMLAVPKAEGRYPAILLLPGAGVRPYGASVDLAEQGYIALTIGIHGIPVDMDSQFYNILHAGALDGYQRFGINNKDEYYFKRVYTGCVRSVDFIFSLHQFDGNNVYVRGGSQGGALSIVTASLDKRIKALAVYYPALADITGYMHNRAGGWPHLKNKEDAMPQYIETSKYYDVVNFARHISVPVFYALGYNDLICPPTSMYAAYNVIIAPKKLFLIQELGHTWLPYLDQKSLEWIKGEATH